MQLYGKITAIWLGLICLLACATTSSRSPSADAVFVSLDKSVSTYWHIRAKKDFKNLFSLEAPYIQFLTPFRIYRIYLAHTITPEKIEIIKRRCGTQKEGIYCDLYLKLTENNKSSFIHDEWVYIADRWYHVIKDRIVFPQCFPP